MPHEDIDIASAPAVPGSNIEPVPAPESNPYLEEETDSVPTAVVVDIEHEVDG